MAATNSHKHSPEGVADRRRILLNDRRQCENAEIDTTLHARVACGHSHTEEHRHEETVHACYC